MIFLLMVRGLFALTAGAYLATADAFSWERYVAALGWYLMIDGLIGAALSTSLLRESVGRQRGRELGLGLVVLVDAAGRLLSGAAIHYWPGMAGFPVTSVLFIAIMAASTMTVGLTEAWLTAREEVARHGHLHQAPQFMAGPVGLASLVSLGFGIASLAFIGSPDTLRQLISGFVGAAGVVALAMAWSRRRMSSSAPATLPPLQ